MISLSGVLGTVLVFGAIIFFHELGHFIVAKISGMGVYEFSLGFGPALLSKTYHDTQYAIRAMPLGGYVRIAGMEPDEDPNVANGFNTKPFIAKFATILAGVFMNMVLALVLFIVIGMAIGYPLPGHKTMIIGVMPDTPASHAGLQPGDTIVAIDGKADPSLDDTINSIRTGPVPVQMTVERNGKKISCAIHQQQVATYERVWHGWLYKRTRYRGIGMMPDAVSGAWKRQGFVKSVVQGTYLVAERLQDAVAQFLSIIVGTIKVSELSGPVGIMHMTYDVSKDAFSSLHAFGNILGFIALISVFVGFFNLLPIPALDGSRLFFVVADGILSLFGKRIDPQKEAVVHMVGMIVLLSLVAIITIKDLGQWAGWWKIKM